MKFVDGKISIALGLMLAIFCVDVADSFAAGSRRQSFRPSQRRFVSGSSCGNFGCARRPTVQRSYNNGAYNNNKGQAFERDKFTNVPNFANLAANKGALFERDARGNVVAQLFIDPYSGILTRKPLFNAGFGNVVAAGQRQLLGPNNATNRQLGQFYLRNRQKFVDAVRDAENKNDKVKALKNLQTVDAFLSRNTIQNRGGRFAVQLRDTVIPEGLLTALEGQVNPNTGKNYTKQEAAEKMRLTALNYTLNLLNNRTARPINIQNYADIKTLNLSEFFSDAQLTRLTTDNYYACGDPNAVPRLDWLISRAMDNEVYSEMTDIPQNFENYANNFGIDNVPDRVSRRGRGTTGLTVQLPGDESEVVKREHRRTITVERQRDGQFCYRSNDSKLGVVGRDAQESRDPTFTHLDKLLFDAQEVICKNKNGFPNFFLAAAAGGRAPTAPGEIAGRAHADVHDPENPSDGTTVHAPASCLKCHAAGFRYGNPEVYKKEARSNPNIVGRELYASNAAYRRVVEADNQKFKETLKGAGSYIGTGGADGPPADVLPQYLIKYKKGLTVAEAAKELGVSPAALEPHLKQLDMLAKRKDFHPPEDHEKLGEAGEEVVVSRANFELNFCRLKSRLGVGTRGVDTGVQEGSLIRRQSDPRSRTHR